MKSVFVSYVYEDRGWVETLKSWNLGSDVRITHERADKRQDGKAAIDNELNTMIQGCSAVLVLVGQNSHSRPWIDREIQLAISKNKPVVVARIPGTTGGAPASLANRRIYTLDSSSLYGLF